MSTQHGTVRKTAAQHIVATIKSTGRTMILSALISAVVAAIIVEGYGALASGTFAAPPVQTHVYAVAFALVCAYAAIVTVLLRGVIATLVASLEWVADEVETLTDSIVHQAETVLNVPDGRYGRRETVVNEAPSRR